MKYRPWFFDATDPSAWAGPVNSALFLGSYKLATGRLADFIFDQLYDWTEIIDESLPTRNR